MRASGGCCSTISTDLISPWCSAMTPVSLCSNPTPSAAWMRRPMLSLGIGRAEVIRSFDEAGHLVAERQVFHADVSRGAGLLDGFMDVGVIDLPGTRLV